MIIDSELLEEVHYETLEKSLINARLTANRYQKIVKKLEKELEKILQT
jgi:hypothetical protein